MRRPNWHTAAGHLLRWALVAETVVLLHLATVHIDNRGQTYTPPPTSTTSIATTHICGDHTCP